MLSSKTVLLSLVYLSAVIAAPVVLHRREVPQEHSHNTFLDTVRTSLNLNNPDGIVDPVFGLLGDAAAAGGLGKLTDPDCLQQSTADQAFTNAKAAGDVNGQVGALIYRALERNTGSVGEASVQCTSVKAVNPEIAAIQQHQDPASSGAAATNKAIVLELAKQIAAVGGDPQDALKSGTFAPGKIGDPTGAGNTCDVADDEPGCIFSENLLVDDATAAEISAAVAGVAVATSAADTATTTADSSGATATAVADDSTTATECAAPVTVTVTGAAAIATETAVAVATTIASAANAVATGSVATGSASSTAGNVQTFTGALGGLTAPPVVPGGEGFLTDGDQFVNAAAAIGRSCDVQHNDCANFANSAAGRTAGITVGQCDTQDTQCKAAITS